MTTKTLVPVLALAVTVLAACGGDDASDTTADDTTDTTDMATTTGGPATTAGDDGTEPPATTAPTTAATGAPGTTVSTAPARQLTVMETDIGPVLADDEGYALYAFLEDEAGMPTCTGSCAESWPPLTGTFTAGEGVREGLIAAAPRNDGPVQVAYKAYPLYYFSGDTEPGDLNGQGLNEVWYLVSPEGNPVATS